MKQVSLSGSLRGNVGKKDARKNRSDGKIPCVMYGGKEQMHFIAEEKHLTKILFTPEVYIVRIHVDSKDYETIVQDVQYHPVSDHILHVDFLEIHPEKPVTISIPVVTTGTPKGVLRGGKLDRKMRKLKIRALPAGLPDNVVISIEELEIGESIKVSDLKLDRVTILDPPGSVIIAVRTARQVVEEAAPAEEAAEAAPAEGEKKEETKEKGS